MGGVFEQGFLKRGFLLGFYVSLWFTNQDFPTIVYLHTRGFLPGVSFHCFLTRVFLPEFFFYQGFLNRTLLPGFYRDFLTMIIQPRFLSGVCYQGFATIARRSNSNFQAGVSYEELSFFMIFTFKYGDCLRKEFFHIKVKL